MTRPDRGLPRPVHRPALAAARLSALVLLLWLGCGSGEPSPTEPGGPGGPPQPPPPGTADLVLASGEISLPGASRKNEPGHHEVFVASHLVRADLPATSGQPLRLRLRDASRPGLACPSEEPEDGCATVDWSGDPAEPRVPPGGIFENRLDLELVSGPRRLYLSRTFRLNDIPDLADPLREHTAIGGTGREWQLVLPAALEPETLLELRVIMTKWQAPSVRVAYEIVIAGTAGAP